MHLCLLRRLRFYRMTADQCTEVVRPDCRIEGYSFAISLDLDSSFCGSVLAYRFPGPVHRSRYKGPNNTQQLTNDSWTKKEQWLFPCEPEHQDRTPFVPLCFVFESVNSEICRKSLLISDVLLFTCNQRYQPHLLKCSSRHSLQNLWPHLVWTGSFSGKWHIEHSKSSSTGFTKSSS